MYESIDLNKSRPDCLRGIYLPPVLSIQSWASKKALKLCRDVEDPTVFLSKLPSLPMPAQEDCEKPFTILGSNYKKVDSF